MYAILDIETTGGKYNEEGITEIAIYKFDGHEVVDQVISLVNPERPIQPFVVGLTGINNDMLRNAPKFYEIAKRILEITQDCILVAHNAKFDYRILRTEFRRLGYEYERETLCSVELSKKLLPGHASYSLGKLTKALGIPISSRHRADGDAIATVKLFKLLLQKDVDKEIIKANIKTKPKSSLDTKLIRIVEELPSSTGVYYMHDDDGEIIYVGKSKNIRKRLNQHFTSESVKSREMQNEVYAVTHEATGNELVALLKENQEIKKLKPKYNRALKRSVFNYGLYQTYDDNGYLKLYYSKNQTKKTPITTFTNKNQARSFMDRIIEEFGLCLNLTSISNSDSACFNYSIKKCFGACVSEESVEVYNKRIQAIIDKYSFSNQNMIVVDRGRETSEKSALLIENGVFMGVGYFDLNHQISHPDIIRSIITPMENDRDAQHIIQSYMRRNKRLKIVKLQADN
ncbi:exonuclease domain-containing protein [Croceibacter atlanticus]|uniref:Excinuclease cho n=1 Tax=Croceibacter atlanticus (strain ATCC BAA-628 / JCM 21780 / CIP 108009 / IAM 15332 / KCTC 12090 / HTCC2559) TaxID=216432 RepID=A3U8X5_CROAH|nr:exonuclease domain-containing protein [Croceibacter atlanticus]EAP86261.1 probable DNA-directed DNA polymerase III (epsilon subunit) [Croceibacter atlanticus HTCC2559]